MRVYLDVPEDELAKLAAAIARAGMPTAAEEWAGPAPQDDPYVDPWAARQNGPQTAPGATRTADPLPRDGTRPGPGPGSVGSVEPRSTGSGSYAGPASSVLTVKGPNGLQTWTLSPPNGPLCDCGEPAALVHGPKAKGGFWDAYRCAKGAGDNWRNKCGFNKWT